MPHYNILLYPYVMKIYSKVHGSEGAPHGQVMASTGYHVVRGGPEWVQNDPYDILL